MAITSGLFNSINGDRRYNASWFARYFATFIGNGVFPNPSTGLQLIENENMTTTVKAGDGWINGYFIVNDGDYILQHDLADGVLKRIDRVVMRLNYSTRQIEIVIKKGAFAGSPVAPNLQRDADAYELGLADVLINNGATQITQANITDLRLNTELCGIVHGTVDQVDTTTLFNQYQTWLDEKKAEYNADLIDYITSKNDELNNWYYSTTTEFEEDFNLWFQTIKDLLDESIEGNLLSEMEKLKNKILRDRKEVLDIKLKLSESQIIDFLNKTGIGFYDLFENLDYVDTNTTTASVNVVENEVTFNGSKLLKMKTQQFDTFNNLELSIYDKDREQVNATTGSTSKSIEVLILPNSVNVGDKLVHNNEIYTVAVVGQ